MRSMLLAIACLLAPCNALIVGARPGLGAVAAQRPENSALRRLRLQDSPPPPPERLGATVDQDGKSNVWVSCATAFRARAAHNGYIAHA